MSNVTYPRAVTIVVPNTVEEKNIGEFVTSRASKFINDIGKVNYVPRSLQLRPITPRLWHFGFDTMSPYETQENLETGPVYPDEPGLLEQDQVPGGPQKGLSRTSIARSR